MCVYTYLYTYITYIYISHIYIYICTQIYAFMYTYIFMYTFILLCIYTYKYTPIHTYIFIFILIHTYMQGVELHVMVAATHRFDKSLIDTVICDNISPIEKLEHSTLLVASTIHATNAMHLIQVCACMISSRSNL